MTIVLIAVVLLAIAMWVSGGHPMGPAGGVPPDRDRERIAADLAAARAHAESEQR